MSIDILGTLVAILFECGDCSCGWVVGVLRSFTRRKRGFRMTEKRCQFRNWYEGEGEEEGAPQGPTRKTDVWGIPLRLDGYVGAAAENQSAPWR
jgi:hypothetical protein